MNKGSHFIGQPAYGQLINLLDRTGILEISRSNGGERYVKNFDVWHHLLIMLYAVIKRFDSLREITDSMFPEARKLAHLGISMMPRRSIRHPDHNDCFPLLSHAKCMSEAGFAYEYVCSGSL